MPDRVRRTFRMGNVILADFRPQESDAARLRRLRLYVEVSGSGLIRPPDEVFPRDAEGVTQPDEILRPDALDHILFPLPDKGARHSDLIG